MYLHPHSAPQKIPMGNHRIEHYRPQVNTTSPIMSEATIVETQKQHVGIVVPQSLVANITTIRVQTIVAPNMDVVRMGVLIGSTTKLGSGSDGVLVGWKLNGSMTLPTIIGIIRKP